MDPSIYLEDKVMTELMSGKFVPGNVVPRFKDLEQGKSILLCAPRLERDTEKARQWDEAAGMSKQNWDMGMTLAL